MAKFHKVKVKSLSIGNVMNVTRNNSHATSGVDRLIINLIVPGVAAEFDDWLLNYFSHLRSFISHV